VPESEKKRIVATDLPITESLARRVAGAGGGEWVVRAIDELDGSEKREGVEVVVLLDGGRVTDALFREMPRVRLLQSMSAGVDFIDISAIPPTVALCSNGGAFAKPIAEHAFGMALHLAKNLSINHERLRDGLFEGYPESALLAGKTLGAIGAGGIGRAVARAAKGFEMRTIGISTTGRPVEGFDEVWRTDRLDELLGRADVVVVSLPLNNRTRHLIDARRLALMKEDCILVNVARGDIVAQDALYSHLRTHPMFRAGIDVWWRYPRKGERFELDFPFFELPNFLASPHAADAVPEALAMGREHAFSNVIRYLDGLPPERVVDRSDYVGFRRTPGR